MSPAEFEFPPPKYSAFTQAVRKYRPSQLLPLLAAMTARVEPNFNGYEDVRKFPPWIAAAIARESIVRGTELRNSEATQNDILKLAQLHHEVFVEPKSSTLSAIIGPSTHEQVWWQIHLFEEWTRAVSLYEDETFGAVHPWVEVLGITVTEALRAAFVLGLGVNSDGGRWDPARLDLAYTDPRLESHTPRRHVERLAGYFAATIAQLRGEGQAYDSQASRDKDLQKYPLNPLMRHPLVDLGEEGIWAPVGSLVWRVLLPETLYVEGARTWGASFTQTLGRRYQEYIGALLRNIAPDLHPEVSYGKGGGQLSVDWIWVTDHAVVLVECKSAGLGIGARAGGGNFAEIINRYLVKGRTQIDNTAQQIRDRTPGFEHIPGDRHIVGLVVTSEPFHFANARFDEFGPAGQTPSLVVSARELEHFSSYDPVEAIVRLLEVFKDDERRTWNLEQALRGKPAGKPPVAGRRPRGRSPGGPRR